MPERSSRDVDAKYSDPGAALRLAFRQAAKLLYTAMPGEVVSYDAAKRRAVVQPLLRIAYHNQPQKRRPPLHDVPVMQPWGGELGLHLPIARGDIVWLMFSMRGTTEFKRTLAEATPDTGSLMAAADAFAVPAGIKPSDVAPAEDGWLCIQSQDGATSVRIHATEGVVVEKGDKALKVTESEIVAEGPLRVTGNLTVQGGSVEHDGTEIGKGHDHDILATEILKVAAPKPTPPTPPSVTTRTVEDS